MTIQRYAAFFSLLGFVAFTSLAARATQDGQDLFRVPAQADFDPLTLDGYWESPTNFNGDADETTRLKITDNTVKIAKRCRGFSETLYVAVEAPLNVTLHTIEILWGDRDTDRNSEIVCSVGLQKTSPLTYRIYNGRLFYDGFANEFGDAHRKFSDLSPTYFDHH